MSILRKAGTTAAISVAGAGIALGGIGMASASEDGTAGADSAQSNASAKDGGHRGHSRGDGGERATALAEALDLDESDVAAALKAVREDREPKAEDGTRSRPTEAEREARRAEMASALADELGVSDDKVTDALDSLAAERKADGVGRGHGRGGAADADKSAATS